MIIKAGAIDPLSTGARGVVVAYSPDGDEVASDHERATQADFARRLAAMKRYALGGNYDPARRYPGHVYFVPSRTLTAQEAASLRIKGPNDLFGGVVPFPFVATKAITHPLVERGAAAPPGWNSDFAQQVGDAALGGYAAFNAGDAFRAGLQLLARGPVRLKPARASAGRGQAIARDAAELRQALQALDAREMSSHGLVLEECLAEVRTFSVGQVSVDGLTASYLGLQHLTRDNAGEEVYGGSELTAVRGGFEALQALATTPEMRCALDQATRYDAAVRACFPAFFASRSNYDVLAGIDGSGRSRSGVLEQSWRIGGATSAELAVLEVFREKPACRRVRAAAVEIYGDSHEPPPHASVHFRGTDAKVGRLTKYAVVEPDDDAR